MSLERFTAQRKNKCQRVTKLTETITRLCNTLTYGGKRTCSNSCLLTYIYDLNLLNFFKCILIIHLNYIEVVQFLIYKSALEDDNCVFF